MKTFIFKPLGTDLAIVVLHTDENQAGLKAAEVARTKLRLPAGTDIAFGAIVELSAENHCCVLKWRF